MYINVSVILFKWDDEARSICRGLDKKLEAATIVSSYILILIYVI